MVEENLLMIEKYANDDSPHVGREYREVEHCRSTPLFPNYNRLKKVDHANEAASLRGIFNNLLST